MTNQSSFDLHDPRIVAALDDLSRWPAPFGQKILELVKMQHDMRVLDVGCGMGFPLIELSQRLGATCQCFGLDPWEEAVQRAQHKLEAWNISNVNIRTGVAAALPFESGFF